MTNEYTVNLRLVEPEFDKLSDTELAHYIHDIASHQATLEDIENTASYLLYTARQEQEKRNPQG